jgi:hypothetical protein|tara:strand:- start:75 stop:728 length:654 start_codon:yes stop_codon:yes gene_type:complete
MKVKIDIPDSLSEITLDKYQKYLKIQENNTDETFLAIKMIEIFLGLRGDTIMKIKAKSIKDITLVLTEMFTEKPELVKEFTMKGVKYGFIPNLEDMTFGEYVDLDTFIGDANNLHRAMAVLYRPIIRKTKDKYLIQEYEADDNEIMKDMPMNAVLSSILFFYHLGMDLSKTMLNYLQEEENKDILQQLTLVENGDGTKAFFQDSLKEILRELKISLN